MAGGESAFWQFSLRFYRRAEIPPLCLSLQDQCSVDVNVLFFVLYLATRGHALTADDVRQIDGHTEHWRSQVVQSLRAIRRGMKDGIAPIDAQGTQVLREAIKRDELQAERLQQQALEREFPVAAIGMQAAPHDAAAANLAAYSAAINALPRPAIATLLTALKQEFSL